MYEALKETILSFFDNYMYFINSTWWTYMAFEQILSVMI